MKAVILAGGLGTRISEESALKPKPMIEIGGMPIIWHIMKIYSHYGINEFIICLGYKGYLIKEYFSNYFLHTSDLTIDMNDNSITVHNKQAEPWKIILVDTGLETMTGGRLKNVEKYLDNETFCLTYGDGLANVNITDLIKFHKNHGLKATVTAIKPPGRFGALKIDENNKVSSFIEKPQGDQSWINGGFFVFEKDILNYIDDEMTILEKEPLEKLANESQLLSFKHNDFWQPMDTLRDKKLLEEIWNSDNVKWKCWD